VSVKMDKKKMYVAVGVYEYDEKTQVSTILHWEYASPLLDSDAEVRHEIERRKPQGTGKRFATKNDPDVSRCTR
jgi:hypothetical protein